MNALSLRHYAVLQAAAQGKGVRETGRELFLSPETVKTYRRQVLQQLGARNMTQAVAMALTSGLIAGPGWEDCGPSAVPVERRRAS